MSNPLTKLRRLALLSAALLVAAVVVVWLTIDSRLPRTTFVVYVSIAACIGAPLLFASRRLARTEDPSSRRDRDRPAAGGG